MQKRRSCEQLQERRRSHETGKSAHACDSMSHAEKGVANGVANFTVRNVIPTLSERASTIGIVKDHGPCVATQDDIKIGHFMEGFQSFAIPK